MRVCKFMTDLTQVLYVCDNFNVYVLCVVANTYIETDLNIDRGGVVDMITQFKWRKKLE